MMKTMINQAYRRIWLLFLAIGCTLVVKGEEQRDSLFSYLEIAARHNPAVLQRYAEYQASLRKVPQVGSLPDPDLSLGVFLSPMELIGGKQVADIRLMQMFPWFGVLKNARDEMSLMAKAKYEIFRDAKLQVYFDVQRTWYELGKVGQNIRVSEKNIELLRTIERLAIVKFKAGPTGNTALPAGKSMSQGSVQSTASAAPGMNSMGSSPASNAGLVPNQPPSPMPGNTMGTSQGGSGLSDVYRIQIEIADLENSINLLHSQLATISAKFNGYLNRSQASLVTIPDTLKQETMSPNLAGISDSILKNNPMLAMIQLEQKSLEARKQMVTRMGYPMVGLGLNYSLINKDDMSTSSMNGKDMVMPMLNVTLPVYRKKYKAMREETEFLKEASNQNYKTTANSLQTEYYQALQLNQDARRRIQLYADQYKLAAKTIEIMLSGFASSGTSLSDILRLRQQILDYQYRQLEAIADYNISAAWFKRLMDDTEIQ